MGNPTQYLKPGVGTAVAMQWYGKEPEFYEYFFAGKVKDFRGWGIDCYSDGGDTLHTADYGDLTLGQYIVKHYPLGADIVNAQTPDSITVEDPATVESWVRTVTDPDGWFDFNVYNALGGEEEGDIHHREDVE